LKTWPARQSWEAKRTFQHHANKTLSADDSIYLMEEYHNNRQSQKLNIRVLYGKVDFVCVDEADEKR